MGAVTLSTSEVFGGAVQSIREKLSADTAWLSRVRALADFLDDAWRIPGTDYRIGAESVIGLIPGWGDLVAAALSCVILVEAARHGARMATLAEMAMNILIDFVIGLVPVVGDLGDVAFKANRRNVAVLEREFGVEPAAR